MAPSLSPDPSSKADANSSEQLKAEEASKVNSEGAFRKKREKVVRVDQIWDKKTRKFHYVKTAKPKSRSEKFSRYVLTVARRISAQGVFSGEYIVDISGSFLCEVLSDIYHDVDGVSFPKNTSLDSDELKLLYYALDPLEQKLQGARSLEPTNEEQTFELEAGVQFIKEHFSSLISDLQSLPTDHITFEHLWALFPYNCLVYGRDGLGQDQVYRAKSHAYMKNQDGSVVFGLKYDYVDSNGRRTGFVDAGQRIIKQFEGSSYITSLSFFPFERHPRCEDLRKGLIIRGEKALRLRGRHLQEYNGHAVGENNSNQERMLFSRRNAEEIPGHALDENSRKFNAHGRVMLDPAIFDQLRPMNVLVPIIPQPIRDEDLTEIHKLLFSARMYGFSFGDKVWGSFAVSELSDVLWDDKIIEALVIPEDRKNFMKAIVKIHGREGVKSFDDVVRDKGKGLIGLLTGPPGVGKTLTAEAVAEIARRPLYMLSSGELGDESSQVQNKLDSILELTETWNAVLLLDEADVFLAKRDDVNLSRNAITSVFLRKLEYYQGILILTTNRSSSFDPAFQSRIHFCFHFDDLNFDARLEIWTNFLKKANETCVQPIQVSDSETHGLAHIVLNGRQIKNVVSMSQAIADEKGAALNLTTLKSAIEFSGYTRVIANEVNTSVMS